MKNILCFGDSNTWGLIPQTHDRYPSDIRWTGLIKTMLGPYGCIVTEEGLCGRTTVFEDRSRPGRSGIKTLPLILRNTGELFVSVIMLGTNDCKTEYRADAAEIAHGAALLIKAVKKYHPESAIILVSPILLKKGVGDKGFDPEFGKRSETVCSQLRDEYKKTAKKYGTYFFAAQDVAEASDADREHLTKQGHAALASAIGNIIIDMI